MLRTDYKLSFPAPLGLLKKLGSSAIISTSYVFYTDRHDALLPQICRIAGSVFNEDQCAVCTKEMARKIRKKATKFPAAFQHSFSSTPRHTCRPLIRDDCHHSEVKRYSPVLMKLDSDVDASGLA